ncbi:MAG: M48 family metalloprotease [Prevotella sp.]|nr:M48 family metalloprotease [Prevotella sp.]
MKRLVLLATMMVLAMVVNAQSSEAKKYIKKYDVIHIVKNLPKGNPEMFWDAIHNQNERVREIGKAIEGGNKTALQTAEELIELCTITQNYDNTVEGYSELSERIAKDMGIEGEHRKHPIRIINDNTYNASMDPMGQMRINVGTIRTLSYEELRAVCAHEIAHLACMHTFDRAWKSERKKKRNRFLAELETGLLVGAAATTAGYGIANGVEMKSANTILSNPDIILQEAYSDADGATTRFKYRYSRDEETEADIIAYRFMEYMGYGVRHFISAMRKMKNMGYHTVASKYDNHPLPAFRLEILETLDSETMNRGNMYSRLIGTGKVTKKEIGTREEFINTIVDKKTAKNFYNNLIGSGLLTVEDIGTEKDFVNSLSADFWR